MALSEMFPCGSYQDSTPSGSTTVVTGGGGNPTPKSFRIEFLIIVGILVLILLKD